MATNQNTAVLALRVIDLLIAGATMIPEIKRRAASARSRIQVMIDEDRDPTSEEWDEIFGESDSLTADIEVAVEAKRRAQPPLSED
jgi:hypothetical protein